jgi:pyrimidine-nucleoside phosphorylase
MNFQDLIEKKRDGGVLTREEIEVLVQGITRGTAPDYQVAAWAMAVFFQGMNDEETRDLALAMAYSGDVIDLSAVEGIPVDKHSTGGVGDKTTLIAIPLAAAAGCRWPKCQAGVWGIPAAPSTSSSPFPDSKGKNHCRR